MNEFLRESICLYPQRGQKFNLSEGQPSGVLAVINPGFKTIFRPELVIVLGRQDESGTWVTLTPYRKDFALSCVNREPLGRTRTKIDPVVEKDINQIKRLITSMVLNLRDKLISMIK